MLDYHHQLVSTINALPASNYFDVENEEKILFSEWDYAFQETFDFANALRCGGEEKIKTPYLGELHGVMPVAGSYDDRDALLFADVAMYRAKLAHRRSVIFEKDEEIDSLLSEGPLEATISRLASALKR